MTDDERLVDALTRLATAVDQLETIKETALAEWLSSIRSETRQDNADGFILCATSHCVGHA